MSLFNTYLEKSTDFDVEENENEEPETSEENIVDDVKAKLVDAGLEIIDIENDIISLENGYMIQVNGVNDYALSKSVDDKIDFQIVDTIDDIIKVATDVRQSEEEIMETFVVDKKKLVNIILESVVNDKHKAEEMFKMLRKQNVKTFAQAQKFLTAFGVDEKMKSYVRDCYSNKLYKGE